MLRDNGLIGIDYAEPYAGGAGLALFLLMSKHVGNIRCETVEDFCRGPGTMGGLIPVPTISLFPWKLCI